MIYSNSYNHINIDDVQFIFNFFKNKKRDKILEVFPYAGSLSISLSVFFDQVDSLYNTNELYSPGLKEHIKINKINNIKRINTTNNIQSFYEILHEYSYIYCHNIENIDIELVSKKIKNEGGLFLLYKNKDNNLIERIHIPKYKKTPSIEEKVEEKIEEVDDSEDNIDNNDQLKETKKKRNSRKTNK